LYSLGRDQSPFTTLAPPAGTISRHRSVRHFAVCDTLSVTQRFITAQSVLYDCNRVFTRSSKRRANIELAHTPFASSVYTIQQTSSKLPANVFKIHVLIARRLLDVCWTFAGSWICCILSSRPIGTPPPGSNVGLGLGSLPTADHVLYRPSNYNPPALLISMLITIERPASCSMFARSCKHPITKLI